MIPGWVGHPRPTFDKVSSLYKVRLFGVEYAALHLGVEGTLYVTRHGWPVLEAILPPAWYNDSQFSRNGRRMTHATGTVYIVRSAAPGPLGRPVDLVVKFSRVGQSVPVWIEPDASAFVTSDEVFNARFVGPFEEFGICEEIRRGPYGPPGLRIRTKRPLAIYVPPRVYQPWQTRRHETDFQRSNLLHDEERGRASAVHLDITRDYVLLYQWVRGSDAQACYENGDIPLEDFEALVPQVAADLEAKGYRMLDIKPTHFILRRRRNGDMLRRHGRLAYVLVDYELVIRTPHHEAQRRVKRLTAAWREPM